MNQTSLFSIRWLLAIVLVASILYLPEPVHRSIVAWTWPALLLAILALTPPRQLLESINRPVHWPMGLLIVALTIAGIRASEPQRVLDIENPRGALMAIGEESGKGTGLVQETHELLKADRAVNFVGNAEGRELFEDRCDVAICDGFVGNVVLKFVEGLAEGLFRTIAHEFDDEVPDLKEKFHGALERVWNRHDYSRYGGAPLLGVDGVCIICHGRSNARAVRNAVGVASRFVNEKFTDAVVARLG